MTVLGAILAGGESRRFGRDKATAPWRGVPMLDHVRTALAPQVDAVVVCGRAYGLPDRPRAGLGPLGGVAAALAYAAEHGFDWVLTVPCDTPRLPADLLGLLGDDPAGSYLAALPVIGRWPSAAGPPLDAWLASDGSRSVLGWASAIGAAAVALPAEMIPINVNRPDDLDLLDRR